MLNKEELDNLILLIKDSPELGLEILNNPDLYLNLSTEDFNRIYSSLRKICGKTYFEYVPEVWNKLEFRKYMIDKIYNKRGQY